MTDFNISFSEYVKNISYYQSEINEFKKLIYLIIKKNGPIEILDKDIKALSGDNYNFKVTEDKIRRIWRIEIE